VSWGLGFEVLGREGSSGKRNVEENVKDEEDRLFDG
jgi:hypothetical protein